MTDEQLLEDAQKLIAKAYDGLPQANTPLWLADVERWQNHYLDRVPPLRSAGDIKDDEFEMSRKTKPFQPKETDMPETYGHMLESAWGLIANAYGGDWKLASNASGWKEAAEKWRDQYHESSFRHLFHPNEDDMIEKPPGEVLKQLAVALAELEANQKLHMKLTTSIIHDLAESKKQSQLRNASLRRRLHDIEKALAPVPETKEVHTQDKPVERKICENCRSFQPATSDKRLFCGKCGAFHSRWAMCVEVRS